MVSLLGELEGHEVREVLDPGNTKELSKNVSRFYAFYNLVKTGAPLDLKNTRFRDYQTTGVIISGEHYGVDVTGNELFGYAGAAAGFSEDILLKMAGLAQKHSDKKIYGKPLKLSENWYTYVNVASGVSLFYEYADFLRIK